MTRPLMRRRLATLDEEDGNRLEDKGDVGSALEEKEEADGKYPGGMTSRVYFSTA